jgi:dihydroxyacetone kinase-like predicted kinase
VSGQKIEVEEEAEDSVPDLDAMHANEEAWGYCTEFLVTGFAGDAGEFEDHIHSIGRSVLVIPDDDLVKVHLHTQDPGDAISYAGSFGRLAGVKVDDMEDQVRSRSGEPEKSPVEAGNLAVVAASRGEGSRKLYESMGVLVIEGGQGANPSAAEFAEAVERSGAESVILLPNNKNIIPTVEQVGELVEAETYVIPTKSIAGGLAVMVGFDSEGDPDEVVEEMCEIAGAIRSGEVTQAVRDAKIEGRDVPKGAYIGLLDGDLVAVEESVEDAAVRLAENILDKGADVITLLKGEDLEEEALRKISAEISSLDEDVELELHDGGQPMYPVQMVAE